jgi:hypothetical protein
MRPRRRMAAADTVALQDDDEESTDIGQALWIRCVPCRGSGQLVTQFSPSTPSRRSCVACGGKGIVRLPAPKG